MNPVDPWEPSDEDLDALADDSLAADIQRLQTAIRRLQGAFWAGFPPIIRRAAAARRAAWDRWVGR